MTELRTEEDSVRVATALGICYLAMNKVDEAAKCLDPLVNQQQMTPGLKLALGRLEAHRGDDVKAEKHLLEGLKLVPEHGPILYELGRLYERQRKFDKAIECYRRLLDTTYDVRP